MKPRFVGRLSPADVVTAANAAMGFLAVAVAFSDVDLSARIMLLAAIADGLDGVLARRYGGSEAGPYLDSLADVASFGVAPAVLVYVVVRQQWNLAVGADSLTWQLGVALVVPALFVAMAVIRLALYTAYDADDERTTGVPSTLAATIMGAAILSGYHQPALVLGVTGMFVYLMVSPIQYPDLLARDALLMGVVHAAAVAFPYVVDRSFPAALLLLGLAYLVFGPWLYWRDGFPVIDQDADPTEPTDHTEGNENA